ncbi:hypothetical protein C8R45DRAFT_1016923 [Mycena sanguinolenta]|nr:hypothetical protein C8R45DRAFT_1016923 [Mycena sanguinolenta]
MLLQIFKFFSAFPPPAYENDWDGMPYTARVGSMYYLLRYLGQVCVSWRDLVMETTTRMMQLASLALERSAIAPLNICIRGLDFDATSGGPVLELLTRHSHRWKEAMIWANEEGSQAVAQALALADGNFPLLESLYISGLPNGDDFFERAPHLTELTLEHPIPPDPALPWQQLRSLTYTGLCEPTDISIVADQLSRCPQITRLSFHGLSIAHSSPSLGAYALPAIVSDVHALRIGLFPDAEVNEESPSFVALLGCITLRQACTLRLESEHGQSPFGWSQTAFLAFSTRSSLHDTLRTLGISNVMITADQLLECLSGLPRVEALSISDPCPSSYDYFEYGFTETLALFPVDNALLHGLTWTPKSDTLVPQLHSFACKTFMQFEESNYLDFVSSRVGPGRNVDGPFQSSILHYQHATVSPVLASGLFELVLQKVLRSRLEHDHSGAAWPHASKLDPNNLSKPPTIQLRDDFYCGDWSN